MAFTSETVLKFGTTPVSFVVITLLDYALENEKAGAFDYRRKEKISLQGLFSNRESNVPIAEHFRQVKFLLESSTDFVDIKLNDKSYGKARFLGFSFPTSVNFDENSVRFSKINIQLEILKDDSSNTFSAANLPSSVSALSTIWYKLKNFTESFSFRVTDENYFEATHDISFGLDNIDKNTDPQVVLLANQVANIFFAQGLDTLSRIRPFYSPTNFQISALDYGSSQMAQTVDLINYTFAYAKQYKVLSANNSSSSETITTEISFKENGILEVVEKGRIKGNGADYATARRNAIARLDVNLAGAYTRCNDVFNRYLTGSNYSTSMSKFFPKYNTTDTLKTNPIAITKDLSEFGPEIGYEIRFTTDKSIGTTRIHSYSVSLVKGPQGVYEATVDGSIKYYTNKNRTFSSKISDIKSIIDTDDNSIIDIYYPSVAGSGNFGGIKTSSSLNHLKFGVETTYSKSYSNSPTLIASGNLIRQVLISENISLPINQYSTVIVPGYFGITPAGTFIEKSGKETIYQTRQLTVGTKNITLNMKVDRGVLFASGTGVNLLVDTVFSNLKTLMVDKMMDKTNGYLFGTATPAYAVSAFNKIYNEISASTGDLTWFLEDLKISTDSSYNIKADLVFKFLLKKEAV
jgi:hypothetical protein